MDLHAPQIQGFFDVPVDHLYAAPVLNGYFQKQGYAPEDLVVVSPDEGSIKRAIGHSKRMGGKLAIVDKRRVSALETQQNTIIGGPVEGKICLMFDDMISTAGSICGAAELVHRAGAKEIHIAATHGVLCGKAIENIKKAPIDSVVITNSIPLSPEKQIPSILVLSVAGLCWLKRFVVYTTTNRLAKCLVMQADRGLFAFDESTGCTIPRGGRPLFFIDGDRLSS
ncbi:MAG: ribose-phosphate diphosphokinase [Pirellulales bacterium]